jgi:hypothetical protein
MAGLLAKRTADRTMPPWNAQSDDTCAPRFPWKGDERLSDAEIALFDAWAKAGAPEGDPKKAPPPKALPSEDLPNLDQELVPAKPFKSSGNNDQYRCFVLDPHIEGAPKFISGTHIVAGDPKVVHHALVYADAKDQASALVGPDGSYDCFGGPGIDANLVAAWAPGGRPAELPDGAGLPIEPGTKLVMQIHYHPAGGEGTDATKVQLRYTKSKPKWGARVDLLGNDDSQDANGDGLQPGDDDPGGVPTFVIPANKKNHVETDVYTIPTFAPGNPALRLYGLATHMHYVGTDMSIEVARKTTANGDPAKECLLGTPNWNFNWQRFYFIDQPIESLPELHAGDRLTMRCTYDNSKDNPFVVKALLEQNLPGPKDVVLGETTLDEMCLGAFMTLFPL